MKKEYKIFGRVDISPYIYYVIMREIKTKVMNQKEIKKLTKWMHKQGVNILERKQFPKEVKWDSSAVYGMWNPDLDGWSFTTNTSPSAANYFNEIIERWDAKVWDVPIEVRGRQTYSIPLSWNTKETLCNHYCPTNLILVAGEGYELNLFPYHDGIMVQAIVVDEDKRGSGIGSEIMNKLYDLSEELEVPLYLVPFPAGKNDASKIYESVERLEKWYDKLGFGPVEGHPTMWSNY